jgi:hypothetical protein
MGPGSRPGRRNSKPRRPCPNNKAVGRRTPGPISTGLRACDRSSNDVARTRHDPVWVPARGRDDETTNRGARFTAAPRQTRVVTRACDSGGFGARAERTSNDFNFQYPGLQTRHFDLAAAFARALPAISLPSQSEGAGNAGRPMRPLAACAIVVIEYTRVSRSHRNRPASPAQWF